MGNHLSFIKRNQLIEQDVAKKSKGGGRYEYEILGPGPEASESQTAWSECTKNPRHRSYIPVNEFNKSFLPEEIRSDHLFQCIKDYVCNLTVRLRVNHTSTERSNYQHMDKGMRTGTGFIINYVTYDEAYNGRRTWHARGLRSRCISNNAVASLVCPCPECYGKTSPAEVKWAVEIVTAAHVVFNDEEAQFTLVDLFYDDLTNARPTGEMKTLWGMKVLDVSIKEDKCYFLCAVHDQSLAMKLKTLIELFDETNKNVLNPPVSVKQSQTRCNYVMIASHPHGQPKKLTFGKVALDAVKQGGYRRKQLVYEADTCPGSSGAPVFSLGRTGVFLTRYVHCQGDTKLGLNRSSLVYIIGSQRSFTNVILCPARGSLITNASMLSCCNAISYDRLGDNRWTEKVTEWQPREGRRSRGRQRRIWRDDLVHLKGATWRHDAQHRQRWRADVEGYFQQWRNTAS